MCRAIESDRQNSIQVLRAIAILAVIMIHTCPSGNAQVIFRPFVNFGVALFLFLSGYLTKMDDRDWIAFYKKRILRVSIPYIVWTILYSFVNKELGGGIVYNLITGKAAPQMYYIPVYIQFMLFTPFLEKLAKSKYRCIGWTISPISVVVFKYIWLFSRIELNKYGVIIYSICCMPWMTFYYLGLLIGNHIEEKKFAPKILIIGYVISILFQMGEGYIWYQIGESNCGTQLKFSSFLTSTIACLIAHCYIKSRSEVSGKKRIEKWIASIGDCSFGIYLSHIMIMKVLRKAPFYFEIPYGMNSIIVLLVSFICVLIGQKICGGTVSRWIGLN